MATTRLTASPEIFSSVKNLFFNRLRQAIFRLFLNMVFYSFISCWARPSRLGARPSRVGCTAVRPYRVGRTIFFVGQYGRADFRAIRRATNPPGLPLRLVRLVN